MSRAILLLAIGAALLLAPLAAADGDATDATPTASTSASASTDVGTDPPPGHGCRPTCFAAA